MKLIPSYYNAPSVFNRFNNGAEFFGLPSFSRLFQVADQLSRPTYTGPDVDTYEEGNQYHVQMELPGVQKEQLKLEVKNDLLTIEVNQGEEEKSYRHVRQSLKLPRSVDTQSVQAKLENGVLTVTLTKREEATSRLIEIN